MVDSGCDWPGEPGNTRANEQKDLQDRYPKDIILREIASLREEQENTKKKQLTFLTATVAATSLILAYTSSRFSFSDYDIVGIGAKTGAAESYVFLTLVFLIPLLLIIPAWCIFFNQSTTITRIVGYIRLLENILLDPTEGLRYIGWESSLHYYRFYASEKYSKENYEGLLPKGYEKIQVHGEIKIETLIKKIALKRKRDCQKYNPDYHTEWEDKRFFDKCRFFWNSVFRFHPKLYYWSLIYRIFFFLATGCITLSWIFFLSLYMSNQEVMNHLDAYTMSFVVASLFSIAFVLLSTRHNLVLLYDLKEGYNTYDSNYEYWKVILDKRWIDTADSIESNII